MTCVPAGIETPIESVKTLAACRNHPPPASCPLRKPSVDLARPTGEVTHKLFIGAEADLMGDPPIGFRHAAG